MEVSDKAKFEKIEFGQVFAKILERKFLFIKVWIITFALSCVYILPKPRIYTSELMLAPESASQSSGGSLSSLASSFGLNLGGMESSDAFFPEIYPDVISSNEFIVGLFDAAVETEDGSLKTDYYTYLARHQKKAFYDEAIDGVLRTIKGWFTTPQVATERAKINPNHLDKFNNGLVQLIKDNVSCSVSKMTNVITITVSDQDPMICATIADSVRIKLQDFITNYRTKKARQDADYYHSLCCQAETEYNAALNEYSVYCDAHANTILQAYISERDRLENELSNKLGAYNAMTTQYQAAAAKVQERTPSFTILQHPSVPLKPTKPKRMIFVAIMLILSTCITGGWIIRKELIDWF